MLTSSCYPTASCIAALLFGECIRSRFAQAAFVISYEGDTAVIFSLQLPWAAFDIFSAFAVVFHWTRHEDATIDDFIDVLEEA